MLALAATPAPSIDTDTDVALAVRRYCHRHRDDHSTTTAAIAWALRAPGHTLLRVQAGNKRADQLRARQLANRADPVRA